MNQDQQTLVESLIAVLGVAGVTEGRGDMNYIVSNMVAKVALAADEYFITKSALDHVKSMGVDITKTITRSRLYGKKKGLVYEHSLPCSIVRQRLYENPQLAPDILQDTGVVVIVTREEDNLLNSQYKNTTPGDSVFARYDACGIELSDQKVSVKGAICR